MSTNISTKRDYRQEVSAVTPARLDKFLPLAMPGSSSSASNYTFDSAIVRQEA